MLRKRRGFNYDDINKKSERDAKMKNKTKMRKKKEKIEIKFRFLGKIIDEYLDNPREGTLR